LGDEVEDEDEGIPLQDYHLGFIAATLYARGIIGPPTEEQFREAVAVLNEFMALDVDENGQPLESRN